MSFSPASNRTTFVLVPGAGTDPGAWQWTIAALEARGHEAVAPPLPLSDPEAGPVAHAAAVVDAARDLPGRLVVVGQSLGAFTAPLVAARMPVTELVLVAPMIPAPGETAGEWWSAVGHDKAIAPLVERLGPMSSWGPNELAEVFLHDVPAEIAQASERFNRAPGPGMFREPWPLSGWPDVPTRVFAPRDDRLFPLAFQQRVTRERLGLPVQVLPGGHLPMLARPEELAAHLATRELRPGASRRS